MNITVNYTTVTGVLSYVLDASNITHWEQTHIYYTTMTELLKFTIEVTRHISTYGYNSAIEGSSTQVPAGIGSFLTVLITLAPLLILPALMHGPSLRAVARQEWDINYDERAKNDDPAAIDLRAHLFNQPGTTTPHMLVYDRNDRLFARGQTIGIVNPIISTPQESGLGGIGAIHAGIWRPVRQTEISIEICCCVGPFSMSRYRVDVDGRAPILETTPMYVRFKVPVD